jgi:hypothetical protein
VVARRIADSSSTNAINKFIGPHNETLSVVALAETIRAMDKVDSPIPNWPIT